MNNQSQGSITFADAEIALSRAGAQLYLEHRAGEYTATVVCKGDEHVFSCQSMTDAIETAAGLAGVSLLAEAA